MSIDPEAPLFTLNELRKAQRQARRRHFFGLPLILTFPDHTPSETIERLVDEIQAHTRTIFLLGMAIGLAFGVLVVALFG